MDPLSTSRVAFLPRGEIFFGRKGEEASSFPKRMLAFVKVSAEEASLAL